MSHNKYEKIRNVDLISLYVLPYYLTRTGIFLSCFFFCLLLSSDFLIDPYLTIFNVKYRLGKMLPLNM